MNAASATAFVRRRPVGSFLLLAFPGMWVPLCATLAFGMPVRLTSAVGAVVGLALPALLVTAVVGGRPALRSMARRSVVPTGGPLLFAAAVAAIPAVTVVLALLVEGGAAGGRVDVLPVAARFAVDLVVAVLTIQLAEEVGWSGLVQDTLQVRHGPLRAAALVAPLFALIHLPTYLVGGPVTPSTLAAAVVQLVPITLFAIAFRALIGWSYLVSGGGVLVAAVTHASFNTTSGDAFLDALGTSSLLPFLPLVAVLVLATTVVLAGRGRLTPAGADNPGMQLARKVPVGSPRSQQGSTMVQPRNGRSPHSVGSSQVNTPGPTSPEVPLQLLPLSMDALQALLREDLETASRLAGAALTPYFLEHGWLWEIRVAQARRDPRTMSWIARAAVDRGVVVGHVGFHGPPDEHGMVEVAYSVDPTLRRRGYAKRMLAAALTWAHEAPAVTVVRASVAPTNTASIATLAPFAFQLVGEQWDDDDGLELIYELRLAADR